MPIYTYECASCAKQQKHLRKSSDDKSIECECGGEQSRLLPFDLTSESRVVVDRDRGVTQRKGQSAMMKDRNNKHRMDVEKADLVDKHGLQTAVEKGWVSGKQLKMKKAKEK